MVDTPFEFSYKQSTSLLACVSFGLTVEAWLLRSHTPVRHTSFWL